MDTKTASTKMQSILKLFDLHTTFFKKALVDITDKDAHNRLNTKANHMAWLSGSLVSQRYSMAKDIGIELKQAGEELFKDHKGIQDNVSYPAIAQYLEDWDTITPQARKAITNITDEKLNDIIDMGDMKMPLYDLITFTIYREASCIGQLALWRRLLGYDALKYD